METSSRDELQSLASAFNAMTSQLCQIISLVKVSTDEAASLSVDLSRSSQLSLAEAAMQKVDTETISSMMDQVLASSAGMAMAASNSQQLAGTIDERVKAGERMLEEENSALQILTKELRELGATVRALADEGVLMEDSLGQIREITESTNLLALNAAIEAARAGDAGRGFAVVADEVRNLARRAQKIAGDVQSGIDRLMERIHEAVNRMRSNEKSSEEMLLKSQNLTQGLSIIIQTAAGIVATSSEISLQAAQQHQSIKAASERTLAIHAAANNTEQASKDTANVGRDLMGLTTQLKALVGQFKTREGDHAAQKPGDGSNDGLAVMSADTDQESGDITLF